MKIYLVNEYWYEGHETIASFKCIEDARSFLLQLWLQRKRINVGQKILSRFIDEYWNEIPQYEFVFEIEEIELE